MEKEFAFEFPFAFKVFSKCINPHCKDENCSSKQLSIAISLKDAIHKAKKVDQIICDNIKVIAVYDSVDKVVDRKLYSYERSYNHSEALSLIKKKNKFIDEYMGTLSKVLNKDDLEIERPYFDDAKDLEEEVKKVMELKAWHLFDDSVIEKNQAKIFRPLDDNVNTIK